MSFLKENAPKYDLRALHKFSTCTGTPDGSLRPTDGWVYDYIVCAEDENIHTIGFHGKLFHNGSRENRVKSENWAFAEQMWELKLLLEGFFQWLHEAATGKRNYGFLLTGKPDLNEVFLEHPAVQKLLEAAEEKQISLRVAKNKISVA